MRRRWVACDISGAESSEGVEGLTQTIARCVLPMCEGKLENVWQAGSENIQGFVSENSWADILGTI